MEYSYKPRRPYWQPIQKQHQSPLSNIPINQTNSLRPDALQSAPATAEKCRLTAATMETLGIKIRPPGPAPPPPISSSYQASRSIVDRAHLHPTYNAANGLSHQQPVYWVPYNNDILPHYSLPTTTGAYSKDLTEITSTDLGYSDGYNPKISDESFDMSHVEPDLNFLEDAHCYPAEYQKTSAEVLYPLIAQDASTTFPFGLHFSASQSSGPLYVFRGSDTPPATSASDLSSQLTTEPANRPPAEYYTPESSLTMSSAAISPILSPRHASDPARPSKRLRTTPVSPGLSQFPVSYTSEAATGIHERWTIGSGVASSTSLVPSDTTAPTTSSTPAPTPITPTTTTAAATATTTTTTTTAAITNYYHQNPPKVFRHLTPSYEVAHLAGTDYTNPPILRSTPAMLYPHHHAMPGPGRTGDPIADLYTPLPHGAFRTLHSNVDVRGHCIDHYTTLSDSPDLLGPLQEEPSDPPPEDMHPSDPELIPHEQELRFENDLYTPRWVRGHGNKREGWCGICKPGRWLVLKNSAFWYDKSFTHGVSAATGQAFDQPRDTRRTESNADVWEGLCGSCGDWIPLVSSKKKGTTWFRHAYKCQGQPRNHNNNNRESLKRRRETGSK